MPNNTDTPTGMISDFTTASTVVNVAYELSPSALGSKYGRPCRIARYTTTMST